MSARKVILALLLLASINMMLLAMEQGAGSKGQEAPAAPAEPEPTKEEVLLTEIRDLLKQK